MLSGIGSCFFILVSYVACNLTDVKVQKIVWHGKLPEEPAGIQCSGYGSGQIAHASADAKELQVTNYFLAPGQQIYRHIC